MFKTASCVGIDKHWRLKNKIQTINGNNTKTARNKRTDNVNKTVSYVGIDKHWRFNL